MWQFAHSAHVARNHQVRGLKMASKAEQGTKSRTQPKEKPARSIHHEAEKEHMVLLRR
jgi:hypothetical protein